jgi:hypothetical protein
VADGFGQVKGVDFKESYSPVVNMATVRVLLSIAMKRKWHFAQLDVKTAYLNGFLKEEVFMYIPDGFEKTPGKVCKLIRSLYGLKQSGRCWNQELDKKLQEIGLIRSSIDPCLYRKNGVQGKLFIVVYVDDMLIFAENRMDLESMKNQITETLEITEEEEVQSFLNVQIGKDANGNWTIHQRRYIDTILKRFKMEGCKPMKTPLAQGGKLHLCMDTNRTEDIPYKEAVGMLQYLASSTRPDIAFAGSYLAQFSANPGPEHWTSVKHVMRYLQSSKKKCILVASESEEIKAFSDADWAGSSFDGKSFSGYIVFMGETPILWKAKKQTCISLSTQEAEYVAMGECTKELQWLENLLEESDLNQNQNGTPIMYCDNTSAITLAVNPMMTGRSKHIAIKYHFIRERITDGKLKIEYVPSAENVADILTKGLGSTKHNDLRTKMNIVGP